MQFTNVNNFTANASVGGDNDQYNGRVDHTFSEKHRMFVRYTYWNNLNLPIDPYQTRKPASIAARRHSTTIRP